MERKTIQLNREKMNQLEVIAGKRGRLCKALWEYSKYRYGAGSWDMLWEELTKIYGKSPNLLDTEAEFWNIKLEQVLTELSDKSFVTDMKDIIHMRMEGQFSGSIWRRSYRSKSFSYHAAWAVAEIADCLYLTVQEQNLEEMLYCSHDWQRGFEVRLALELRRNNRYFVDLIKEAILGENTEILLSRKMIQAIVISGNGDLVELLLKLLVAARLQEGLRQSILESADEGSVETLIRILKVCLDEDLFRFSSAIRAFDTWTGLGYGDAKPTAVKKYAALAYDFLTDASAREKYVRSENNLETYLALWAEGCYEIRNTDQKARELLKDPAKYRRILGWYFVTHTDSTSYRMGKAMEHLDERDEEMLAWVVTNLSTTREVLSPWSYNRTDWKVVPVKNSEFPAGKKERERRSFSKIKRNCIVYRK